MLYYDTGKENEFNRWKMIRMKMRKRERRERRSEKTARARIPNRGKRKESREILGRRGMRRRGGGWDEFCV